MQPLVVSILSERRALQPYGLNGGQNGARGKNILKISKRQNDTVAISDTPRKKSRVIDRLVSSSRDTTDDWDRIVNLGGKSTVRVSQGDRLLIQTPGGGGFGNPGDHIDKNPWDSLKPVPDAANLPVLTSGSLHQYTLNQES
jgi:5-oxoprolinase (ATP-hydrolysing)